MEKNILEPPIRASMPSGISSLYSKLAPNSSFFIWRLDGLVVILIPPMDRYLFDGSMGEKTHCPPRMDIIKNRLKSGNTGLRMSWDLVDFSLSDHMWQRFFNTANVSDVKCMA